MAAITRLGLHGVTFQNYGNFEKVTVPVENLEEFLLDVYIKRNLVGETFILKSFSDEALVTLRKIFDDKHVRKNLNGDYFVKTVNMNEVVL